MGEPFFYIGPIRYDLLTFAETGIGLVNS
jgi:hypothetical protein